MRFWHGVIISNGKGIGERISEVKSDYVFCRIDGTPLQRFDKAWRNVLELAEIKDFHFHDLRHTFCSNLLLSGASLKDAKEMIGHRDISMTDRYSHLSMNHNLFNQGQAGRALFQRKACLMLRTLRARYLFGTKSQNP